MSNPITYDQMQDLLNKQANTFASALKSQPSTSPAPTGGSGGGGNLGANAKDINSAVGSMVNDFSRAGKGASTFGQVMDGVSAGLGKVNILGVQQGFDAVRGSLQGTLDTQRNWTNQGLIAAGNTVDWGKKIAAVGGNLDSVNSQVSRLGPSLSGFGATNTSVAKEMLAFQADVKASQLGKTLQSMGFRDEQINEIAAQSMIRAQNLGLSEEKTRKEAIKQVGDFTMSMLGAQNAANKTTEQVLRENQVRSEDLDVQLELLDASKEVQDGYRSLKNVTSDLGTELQGSLDEIFSQGVITEKAGNNLNALGSAGTELGRAALDLRNAKTEEQRKEAEVRLQRAKDAADAYMRSAEFRKAAQSQKYQDDAVGQAMRKVAGQEMTRLQMQSTGAQQLRAAGLPSDVASVRRYQQSQLAQSMTGRDATGKKEPGTELYQNVVAGDAAMRDNYNKLQIEGYNKFGKAVDDFSKAVLMIPGAKAVKTGTQTTPGESSGGTAAPRLKPDKRLEGSPGLNELTSNIKQETAGVPKGWMDVLEKFNPSGELIQVDGEEVVANKKQWTAIGEALNSKVSSITSKSTSTATKTTEGIPADAEKQINDSLSKLTSIKSPEESLKNSAAGFKMPDFSKMPDITKMMGDFKMPDVSKTIESVAGKFGPDMFKPMSSGLSDMFKPISNMTMPNAEGVFGGMKGAVAGLTSELGIKTNTPEPAPSETTSSQTASPSVIPNQDVLASLLEKLNTNVAGMGGLLQEGNQIAQSGNNQLASAADNRFTIG